MTCSYESFLERKSQLSGSFGFEPVYLPDFLFEFQAYLVDWAVNRGRGAIFSDCGTGKGIMALAWAENILRKIGRKVLITTPIAVGAQLAEEAAKFGIDAAVSRDGAECGQGWFQETTSEHIADTLAPLLHWRVCHVSDYLEFDAPAAGFPTLEVLNVYHAGEEGSPIEIAGRTGCVGCNLASQDFTLDRLIKRSQWAYLAPFKRLRPLYAELTRAENRLRKTMETRADGGLVKNCGRLGPLTMEARRRGLLEVMRIQTEINQAAREQGRPTVCLINPDEAIRINELIAANTWPDRWSGEEQLGDEYGDQILRDGSVQPVFMWGE